MTILLAIPLLLALLVSLTTLVLRPTLRRMSVRHLLRRPTETVLIVFGAMLGTAIIASSFLISDTVNSSILDTARTQLGPIDEVVTIPIDRDPSVVLELLNETPLNRVDGVIAISRGLAPVSDASGLLGNANTWVQELDFAAGRNFGGDELATGLSQAGNTPAAGEAVINAALARELNLDPGDELVLHLYGESVSLQVTHVLDNQGIAGFGGRSVFIAPSTLATTWRTMGQGNGIAPISALLISNEGGVFDAHTFTPEVSAQIAERLTPHLDFNLAPVKAALIEEAEAEGSEFLEVFGSIGAFSIIAGILLLINIFVMLGEERKRELGILRAIGFKRNHIVQGFVLEGAAYGLIASALGALTGIGVGWIITQYTKSFTEDAANEFRLVYDVQFTSLLSAFVIGLFITMATVWVMSIRISRLNIISSIKGLAKAPTKPSLISYMASALALTLGALLFVSGTNGSEAVPLVIGPPIAMFAAASLLRRFIPQRLLSSIAGLGSIAWGALVFGLDLDAMIDPSIVSFVAQGVVMVAGAIALLVSNDRIWQGFIRRIRGGLSIKLGTVYPLANRFRTAMLLAMFSLVIFTLTFMMTFMNLFSSQVPQLRDELALGHELFVTSNRTTPIGEQDLLAVDGIERANGVVRANAEWGADWATQSETEKMLSSSFKPELLKEGAVNLVERADIYSSDAEALAGLLLDPTKVLVPEWFVGESGAPANGNSVGHTVTLYHPVTREERQFEIIGTFEDYLSLGPILNSQVTSEFLSTQSATRLHYVAIRPGLDANELARSLDNRFKEHGVNAKSFETILDEIVTEQQSIMSLLEGYLAMGLVIGVAGLGVVLVRAVRERRSEVGTLRAIGVTSSTVSRMFVVESSFIAIQGVVIGTSLGLLSAYQVLVNSDAFGASRLEFAVPWIPLMIMLAIPLTSAMLAAVGPAIQAARIKPAVALRTGE